MITSNELAHDILLDAASARDAEVESYSGRGMYGARCVSVTVESRDLLAFMFELGTLVEHSDAGPELADTLARATWDSMGRDSVVVYWPSIRVLEEEARDEDEG